MKPDCGRVIYLVFLCFAGSLNARPTSTYDAEFLEAARRGQDDLVSSLLDLGANVNHEASVGRTALLEAAGSGSVDVVSLLIEQGADIDHVDSDGRTALLVAAGSVTPFEFPFFPPLIAPPAGSESLNAAKNGRFGVVSTLLEHGSDVNHRDSTGRTALDIATEMLQGESSGYFMGYSNSVINNPSVIEFFKGIISLLRAKES